MDIGVRYTLLLSLQIFMISLIIFVDGDEMLNRCLEIIVIHFYPVSLRRHPLPIPPASQGRRFVFLIPMSLL